ncbi:MAG: hypothetical protein AAFQ19_02775 [Pseudomonadota bacterium]
MKRAISLVATLATLTTATAAHAAEHTILILPDAYFPQITYLTAGDTVHFENASGGSHNIVAKNDSWELGPIPNDGQVTITVPAGMQTTFYAKDLQDENGNFLVEGRMSFSPAPLD